MSPPTFAVVPAPQPGNRIVPTPASPEEGGPPSLVPPSGASGGSASGLPAPLGGATRPLDWRWVAALLFLWLALVAMYELGAPQFANGFAILIAASSIFLLGPAAIAEVQTLIGGS